MYYVLFFVTFKLILIKLSVVNGVDWCSIDCGGQPHTMCQYKSEVCQGELSDSDKELILKLHNEYRMKVATGNTNQPTASNMRVMTWHDEVAEIAERWSHQCQFSHDACRDLPDGGQVGQNIAYQTSSEGFNKEEFIKAQVKAFYDEIEKMHDDVSSFNAGNLMEIGHYTQVVWAETHKLGCGLGITEQNGMHNWHFTCNYYPAGNVQTLPIYLVGSACSKCPEGTSCSKKYPGLCSSEKDDAGGKPPKGSKKSNALFLTSSMSIITFSSCFSFVMG